jgi:hypothetical protein
VSAAGALRARIAAALATVTEVAAGDWAVLDSPVDTVEPPVYLITESPEGATRRTFCTYDVAVEVVCVAARLEPEANWPVAETMREHAAAALEAAQLAPYGWRPVGPEEFAQITYLATRLQLRQPLTIGVP